MARAAVVAVIVHDSVLFSRTGHVGRWANSLARGMEQNAKAEAPERSGELRALISSSANKVGPRHWEVVTTSRAKHSVYVLKGTEGPIMSRRMWGFRQRTGLGYPRGALLDPSRPYTSGIDWEFLRARGYLLKVRAGNGYAQRYSVMVSGQDANPFFSRAAVRTSVRHPSIRGWTPGTEFI